MTFLLISVFVFNFLVIETNSLFCYNCTQMNGIDNDLCNENEPVPCPALSPTCISSINSSGDILYKGCGRCARSDQADVQCYQCDTDLCNVADSNLITTDISSYKSYNAHYNGRSFKMFFDKLSTFWEARLNCLKNNATLASINSEEEQKFIKNIFVTKLEDEMLLKFGEAIPTDTRTLSMWVGGLKKLPEFDNWIWSDDGRIILELSSSDECLNDHPNKPYENWEKSELQNSSVNKCHAISINSDGKWEKISCGKQALAHICVFPSIMRQTTYYNGFLYTFFVLKLSKKEAERHCQRYEGTLADLSVDDVKNSVTSQLAYVLLFYQDVIRFKTFCVNALDSSFDKEICSDYLKLSFMCERYVDDNTNALCDMPTVFEEPKSDSTTKNIPSSNRVFCPGVNVTVADHGVMHFLDTDANRIGYSKEKCTPNNAHRAVMFCTGEKFDEKTLHTINCDSNITNIFELILEYKNDTHNNKSDEKKYANLLSDLAILTSMNDLKEYERAIDVYSDVVSNVQNYEKISLSDMANALTVVNNLKDALAKNPLENKIKDNSNRLYLMKSLEILATKVELVDDDLHVIVADDIKMGVQRINSTSPGKDGLEFVVSDTSTLSSSLIAIPINSVHAALNKSKTKEDLRAVFVYFNNDDLFPTVNNEIPSEIVSASITDGKRTYSVPVKYAMISKNTLPTEHKMCWSEKCMYYDKVVPMWSEYGCDLDQEDHNATSTKFNNDKSVHCACNHTTSFSVVLSEFAEPSLALDIATTIGLIICIIFLTLTVVLFAFSKELRKIQSAFIHANLCACLVISYFIFLIGIHRTDLESLCVVVASLIHFFILAAWGWMVTESVTMYRMFAYSHDRPAVIKSANLSFTVYVTSAVIVLATFAVSVLYKYLGWKDVFAHETCHLVNQDKIWSIYSGGRYCWLHGSPLYFGFLLIAGIALLFNMVVCFIIVRAITWGRKTVTTSSEESPSVHVTRAALVAILLGITWVFAIPLVVFRDKVTQEVFGWLFSISLVFQGVFIFYFFCLRRKDIRDSWFKSFRNSVNSSFISRMRPKSGKDYVNSSFPATYFDNNSHQSSIVTPDNWRRLTSSEGNKDSIKSPSQGSQSRKNSKMPNPSAADNKSIDDDRMSTDLVDFDGDKVFEST